MTHLWKPDNYADAIFAELPANERARPRSFYHPMLLGFHLHPPAIPFDEWDRIGITADSLPLPEGKSVEERVADLFPEIEPSDQRLIAEIKRIAKVSPHVHARCGSCRSWRAPFELLDVRSYPETAERPIFERFERDNFLGPLQTVIDNEATQRDEFGNIIGEEVTKTRRPQHSRPKVKSYVAIDLKNGAGFVCSGCWTRWIRLRLKIGGVTYTRLRHITLLGAPQDALDEHKGRPGWDSPGMTPF